jgi:hypothetical protein
MPDLDPQTTISERDAAKIARYAREFRVAERHGTPDEILNAACRLGYLIENTVSFYDWHKLPQADMTTAERAEFSGS